MLVLSRKIGQKIVIGKGPKTVSVCVVSVGNGKVRLGVLADTETEVNREEVYEQKYGGGQIEAGEAA
jgi:carbon storage regulator CsrA